MFLEFVDGDTSNAYKAKIRGTDDDSLADLGGDSLLSREEEIQEALRLCCFSVSKESKLKQVAHICARQVMRDLESYRFIISTTQVTQRL